MSLLEEIQQECVDPSADLAAILRKCKILGARLGSKELADWLVWESNGYPPDALLPPYRVWPIQVSGHFSGHMGLSIRNMTIPSLSIPEQFREAYTHCSFRESIAGVQALLQGSDKDQITAGLGDLFLVLGTDVVQGYNCVAAWGTFSSHHLAEVLNAVRNRVLDLALELWKQDPEAGSTKGGSKVSAASVTQIFNTTVHGGSGHVIGSVPGVVHTTTITVGDRASLMRVLANHGVSEEDLGALDRALAADPPKPQEGQFGGKVTKWMGSMVKKAASGVWSVGKQTAVEVLATSLAKYYGIDTPGAGGS